MESGRQGLDPDAMVRYHKRLLRAAGYTLRGTVLDFGCGHGEMVEAFERAGFDAYGCDLPSELRDGDERLRPIGVPYRLPFDTGTFDAVLSNQVFEHVRDYSEAFAEIRRVTKSDGVSLHVFPPRWTLRETHRLIPLGTVSALQTRPWLRLWALAGVRNYRQHGWEVSQVVESNHEFLRNQTTYHSRRHLLRLAREHFANARLLEAEQLTSSPNRWAPMLARVPLSGRVWAETHNRALLLS